MSARLGHPGSGPTCWSPAASTCRNTSAVRPPSRWAASAGGGGGGGMGGRGGRGLRQGDVLRPGAVGAVESAALLPERPDFTHDWELTVVPGPHAAPEFFLEADLEVLYATAWEVHFNSARTGVRLVGPRPTWAR